MRINRLLKIKRRYGAIIHIHRPNQNYSAYVARQKEKTLDPVRIQKWTGEEWLVKLDGFRAIFERNSSYFEPGMTVLCLGARTGQECVALEERGVEAIGVDLVAFPPYVRQGDFQNLDWTDGSVDGVFSNTFDHASDPAKFCEEIERVLRTGGYCILHLQLGTQGDTYSENDVSDPRLVVKLFNDSTCVISRRIRNIHDSMNWEVVMRRS